MKSIPKKYHNKKTKTINVNNVPLSLDNFSDSIRNEIDMLDKLKTHAAKLLYKYEIINLAVKAKTSEINALIEQHLKPKHDSAVTVDQSDTKITETQHSEQGNS